MSDHWFDALEEQYEDVYYSLREEVEELPVFGSAFEEDEAKSAAGSPTDAVDCFVCKALWSRAVMRMSAQHVYVCGRCLAAAVEQ